MHGGVHVFRSETCRSRRGERTEAEIIIKKEIPVLNYRCGEMGDVGRDPQSQPRAISSSGSSFVFIIYLSFILFYFFNDAI